MNSQYKSSQAVEAKDSEDTKDKPQEGAKLNGQSVRFEAYDGDMQSQSSAMSTSQDASGHQSQATQRPIAQSYANAVADQDMEHESSDEETSADASERLRLERAMKRLRLALMGKDKDDEKSINKIDDADLLFMAVDFIRAELNEHAVISRLLTRLRLGRKHPID